MHLKSKRSGFHLVTASQTGDRQREESLDQLTPAQLALLARAGSSFPRSLELADTAANIARFLVPAIADLCFVHLDSPPGNLQRWCFTSHTELSCFLQPATFIKRGRLSCGPELRTLPKDWADALTANPDEAARLRRVGFHTELRVPLIARTECIGVITLLSSTAALTQQDLLLAKQLGQIGSIAINNARDYAAINKTPSPVWEVEALNHELKNLVAPILGWARIFRSDILVQRDAILAEGAESLERNARHASRLIEECLDLSSVHRGTLSMEWRTVDLNAIVRGAVDAVRDLIREKGHRVYPSMSPGSLWVEGDGARLQQVLANILSNSAKYCDAKGTICVGTALSGGRAIVTVRDNGCGIGSEDLPRVGEPFFRASNGDRPGVGLGLAISRQILNLHGGQLEIESAGAGRGCLVRLSIPTGQSRAIPQAMSLRDAGKQARILLVEDSADVRTCMRLQIEGLGHAVTCLADAREALNCARVDPPDLICSDIRLGSLDGYTFARLVRSQPETADVPMVAITGFSGDHHKKAALAAGYNAFLTKPVEDEDLQHWIDRLTKAGPALPG